ncbi:MAG: SulP family inorganic anion transporter [Nitrospirae bacterium]|nr:SulP family inorganic anion transporter [Nitrospirota bacterium]
MVFPFMEWLPEAKRTWKADLLAGLTGAVVVLPQGVAFAMIAGLPPQYGIYTAIIPTIIAALFGSSRHLISGPTTAISLVIFTSVGAHASIGSVEFIQQVLTLTFLVGGFQLILGVARLGELINFVSHSVVIGFTSGAAVLIAVSQIKHLLGLDFKNAPHFAGNIVLIIKNLTDFNQRTVIVAIATLLIIVSLKRLRPTWPNMLIGMIGGGLLNFLTGWFNHGVKVIGALPSPIPLLSIHDFNFINIKVLAPPALAIAMLGLMEAVSIARSIALQSGQHIDANREFIGQGLSNMIGSFFSSYASSGSFTRSGVNYRAGAKTPASAIFASIWLFVILMFVAKYAAFLPIASMAAVIMVVAYNLVDFHHIRKIVKLSTVDFFIMSATFLSTLFLELEFAVYVGVLLSIGIYLKQTAHPIVLPRIPDFNSHHFIAVQSIQEQCPQFGIVRIEGDLYFAAMTSVEEQLTFLHALMPTQNRLLIILSSVNHIDVSGVESLKNLIREWRNAGRDIYFYGIKWRLMNILYKSGVIHLLGDRKVFKDKESALQTIVKRLDFSICAKCSKRFFWECDDNKTKISRGV